VSGERGGGVCCRVVRVGCWKGKIGRNIKSASALYSDWPAFHCNLQLFRLRPDMAPVGMSRAVTLEAISPLMFSCLFVKLYLCEGYVVGYDGVN